MFGIRRLKSGLRAVKPSLSPYVQNIYGIELKYIFLEIVHRHQAVPAAMCFVYARACLCLVLCYGRPSLV